MKKLFSLFIILSSLFGLSLQAQAEGAYLTPEQIKMKYWRIFAHKELPEKPMIRLLTYYDGNLDRIRNKNYITFVDFSLDSSIHRMYLIDMRDSSLESFLVAHGVGSSNPRNKAQARQFSNIPGSNMSSLGLYLTDTEPWDGKNGYSVRMIGLEETNNLAYDRFIEIHGADYVTPETIPLGESEGCFAVDRKYSREIIDKVIGGSLLMAWIKPNLATRAFDFEWFRY